MTPKVFLKTMEIFKTKNQIFVNPQNSVVFFGDNVGKYGKLKPLDVDMFLNKKVGSHFSEKVNLPSNYGKKISVQGDSLPTVDKSLIPKCFFSSPTL